MMKSCSITKAVFFACKMKLLITFAAIIRCSESRKLDGVVYLQQCEKGQKKNDIPAWLVNQVYIGRGTTMTNTIATHAGALRQTTSDKLWSMIFSKFIGFRTSVLNCACMKTRPDYVCRATLAPCPGIWARLSAA